MAEIVAGLAASHAPLITAAPETANPSQKDHVYAAMDALRAELERAQPTALVLFSNEHFTNFFLDNFPPVCIGVGAQHVGPVEAWLRVERCDVPGQPDLARWILNRSFDHGFDLPFSEDLHLDHGMMTLLHFFTPSMHLPVVPLIQNCAVKPMPTLRRCYALGQFLRAAVESWPSPGRVALVAGGGLSHWVGQPGMGRLNTAFDQRFLRLLEDGHIEEILALTDDEIEAAGNGAHEIRSWVTLAGAMQGRRARVLGYEPISEWATGMGQLAYDVTTA